MKPRMLNSIVCAASFLIALITFLGAASAQNPEPLINQPLVPDATKPGGAGFTLTALSGTGTTVQLNPSHLDFLFVLVGQQETKTSIMTNVGNTTLHITSIAITGTFFSETNNCGSALGSHQSCDINVTFAPRVAHDYSGTVSITDDGVGSPQHVSLLGSSLPPYCRCGGPCSLGCLERCPGRCYGTSAGALLEEEHQAAFRATRIGATGCQNSGSGIEDGKIEKDQ